MIERLIVVGLITSTEYLQQIESVFNVHYLTSASAKRLASWCLNYFRKYNKAPGKEIGNILDQKMRQGLPEDIGIAIEQIILPELNDDYVTGELNLEHLLDQTLDYFKKRKIEIAIDDAKALLEDGELLEAENKLLEFSTIDIHSETDLDLSDPIIFKRLEKAFAETEKPLIKFSGALGEFLNSHLIRGGFISFMAAEKKGKSFLLLGIAKRSAYLGLKTAFFQAGDMTENSQLIRASSLLSGKPILKKHEGEQYEAVVDCKENQQDLCSKRVRECKFGIYGPDHDYGLDHLNLTEMIQLYEEFPDYRPCSVCMKFREEALGTPWLKKIDAGSRLTLKDAKKAFKEEIVDKKQPLRLSTHANGTLSVRKIDALIDKWEREDGFIPDVIIVDYADLLVPETKVEFRHQQNEIWKGLRGLSQTRRCLLITATQADADSYDKDELKLKNFSEDKRKYAHVTAMFGMNQDKRNNEKRVGVMRLNELVLRESDFSFKKEVKILQNLRRGQPILDSYW